MVEPKMLTAERREQIDFHVNIGLPAAWDMTIAAVRELLAEIDRLATENAAQAARIAALEAAGDALDTELSGSIMTPYVTGVKPVRKAQAAWLAARAAVTMEDAKASSETKITAALDIILRYGGIDGAHHKTWVIDQVVRILTGDGYGQWVKDANDGEDGPETYEWDEGIPP
jgi:hypothetical protein